MATRTVRVSLPTSDAEELVKTAEALIEKHEADPANSPLKEAEVQALKSIVGTAKPIRAKVLKLRQEAQAANEQFRNAVGIGTGQTSKTKGTAYNLVTRMKKQLLLAYEGEEEQLETYGLKVKIGTAKARHPRAKKQ